METSKSLACPALSHFLACLTLPVLTGLMKLSRCPTAATHPGKAGTRGQLLPTDLLWPLKATCACLPTGTAELCGHDQLCPAPTAD